MFLSYNFTKVTEGLVITNEKLIKNIGTIAGRF
jgi:hypothetical protein